MADLRPAARIPLLVLGMLSLVGGVLAGLARLDWNMPAVAANAAGWHGALMISAFLGTVISREGGLLNAIALLLFIITMITSVVRGKRDDQGAA